MEIKTWDDCVKADEEIGGDINAIEIANVYGIEAPEETKLREQLSQATTQGARWKLYEIAPEGASIRMEILEVILTNAQTQDGLWEFIRRGIVDTPIESQALEKLLDLARDQNDRDVVLYNSPMHSDIRKEIIKTICKYHKA